MGSDVAPRLAKNSVYFAIRSVVSLAVMLLLTPYLIRGVGKDQFGIWALAGVMTSYAQLSDFGITESLVKYAAEYHAGRDSMNLNRLVNTALASYLGLALVVGTVLFLSIPYVASALLKIPPALQQESTLIFRFAVIIFLTNMIFGVFASLIIGSQQMGYSSFITSASMVLTAAGTVFFLENGWGLRGLVVNSALVAGVAITLNIVVARRLFPDLRFNFVQWVDRAMLRQIFCFSWKIQASSISQVLIFQLDRILLSRYLGLEAVAFYEVGSTAASYVRTFIAALFSPLSPAASEIHAKKEFSLLAGLYNRSFKFMAMLAIPFCLLVIVLAQPFVQMWMGEGFALAALTLQLLLPAYLVNVLTGPGAFILNGINRPEVGMRSALFAGGLNLFLCTLLIQWLGYFGLIVGISLSLIVSALYFISMLHKELPGLEWRLYGKVFFPPLLVSTPLAITLYVAGTFWNLSRLPVLISCSSLYVVLTVLLIGKSRYLDDFERRIIGGLLPFGRKES